MFCNKCHSPKIYCSCPKPTNNYFETIKFDPTKYSEHVWGVCGYCKERCDGRCNMRVVNPHNPYNPSGL